MKIFDLFSSPLDTWYCCQPDADKPDALELCKIKRDRIDAPDTEYGYQIVYHVVCYYDGKIFLTGSLQACKKWIEEHWIERRYLDQYGKK